MSNITEIKAAKIQNSIDIVFVSDGYTATQQKDFIDDARRFSDLFLLDEYNYLNAPFTTFRNALSLSALFVPSTETGFSIPNLNIQKNTFFSSRAYGSDNRLIYGDTEKVRSFVASQISSKSLEIIVVLINSDRYGGAGGDVSWATSDNSLSQEIMMHEIGHSYGSLEDEYADSFVADRFPLTSLDSVHVTASLSNIPWHHWLGFKDSLGIVGTYEGGYYRDVGVWRATIDSKMNHLGKPFSAPQKESLALEFYRDMGDYLKIETSVPGLLVANSFDSNLLTHSWSINGKQVGSSKFLDTYTLKIANGSMVSLETQDNSGFVRKGLEKTSQTEMTKVNSVSPIQIDSLNYTVNSSRNLYLFDGKSNRINLSDGSEENYIDANFGFDIVNINQKKESFEIFCQNNTTLLSRSDKIYVALKNIERIEFSNLNVAFDADGAAGKAYRVYKAVFNRDPMTNDMKGLGYWIKQTDNGMQLQEVAARFIDSNEFRLLYGTNPTNSEYLTKVYSNVLGRTPDKAGFDWWLSEMNTNPTKTKVKVLTDFSESPENQQGVASLIGNGIVFEPWTG